MQLKDDATDKEIRVDELHRMIETLFEPFDYTTMKYVFLSSSKYFPTFSPLSRASFAPHRPSLSSSPSPSHQLQQTDFSFFFSSNYKGIESSPGKTSTDPTQTTTTQSKSSTDEIIHASTADSPNNGSPPMPLAAAANNTSIHPKATI
ncbi:MAG: hypothetical protein Q9190_006587, partial [Brigantiaea leucoxantha]